MVCAALFVVGCATPDEPTSPAPVVAEEPEPAPPPPELPFDPSPDDKPSLGLTGFVGVADVPAETGFAKGPKIHDVKPGAGPAAAGMRAGDVIVKFADVAFAATDDDAIGTLRRRLLELPFDSDVNVTYWREKEGVREVTVRLGRQPPPYNRLVTPAEWFAPVAHDDAVAKLIADALSLDQGEARYADVLARNRKHAEKTDAFRLREVTQAHLDLAANEGLAGALTGAVAGWPSAAARVAGAHRWSAAIDDKPFRGADFDTLNGCVAVAEHLVIDLDARMSAALAAWSPEDRKFIAESFHLLTARVNEGEYLYDDPQPARERANRRIVKLLAAVDRGGVAAAAQVAAMVLRELLPKMTAAAIADGREGLLAARDTPAGRIEIWGRGNNRHTTRCAFRFDLAGNDDWLDCAGAADLDHPVSISIDWSGNDTYGATSPFQLGGALGGVGILWDREGDDQYLARSWSQGCGVAGFGLLQDDDGRDVYHGQDECQGIGLAGAGVLIDSKAILQADMMGAPYPGVLGDIYTGDRFCQGVGFPGGVGAVIDKDGNDRYVCTGRYDSEYGEPGLFSGWGQGVGFGFRQIASGGIGVLYDVAGDDVYEAGNFSQGGGYFYAWGILRDDAGDDRYIGSRYAQGFAAHQAVGTFIEGGGNDLYQQHSTVANGISWDETSVVFHDHSGNDVYENSGPWLAGAAMNGMVLFLDDAGDDRYQAVPAHAGNNTYHGGHSFALFRDGGGNDTYGAEKASDWNDRVMWREEGAYFVDVPTGGDAKPLRSYVR